MMLRYYTIAIKILLISTICFGQGLDDTTFDIDSSDLISETLPPLHERSKRPHLEMMTSFYYNQNTCTENNLWEKPCFNIKSDHTKCIPDFIPFTYFWLPLWQDISVTFRKGLIGGIIENGITERRFEPKLPLPFKFTLHFKFNTISLLKMNLTDTR